LALLARASRSRAGAALVVSYFAVTALLATTPAPSPQAVSEYKVKAAFLFNFAKFVEWPERDDDRDSVTIGVVGLDPFGESLDQVVRGKTVGTKRIAIRRFAGIDELEPCDILFVSQSESSRLEAILEALDGTATLTVGEDDEFVLRGGIIRFFTQDSKIRFEINLEVAEYEGLQLSSQLLQVARTVPGKGNRGGR
jgi:hypothetical protein